MKKSIWLYLIALLEVFILSATGCKKENDNITPGVKTVGITFITPVSASCGGIITLTGSSEISETGICWSKEQLPTISDYRTSELNIPSLTGFASNISGLQPITTYFVRAYATNKAGTAYGNELSFTTPVDHSGEKGTLTDIEGNVYKTIGIGSQIWTTENMRTTTFNDSTGIPLAKCYRIWSFLFSPGYCLYNNDESQFKYTYGALYNWYTVNTLKLCPFGWHVPGDDEWTILETYLGGNDIAGGKMKESGNTYWKDPNIDATNNSGFTCLPAGYRGDLATFIDAGEVSVFWSSSPTSSDRASYWALESNGPGITRGTNPIGWGASVRCVKD